MVALAAVVTASPRTPELFFALHPMTLSPATTRSNASSNGTADDDYVEVDHDGDAADQPGGGRFIRFFRRHRVITGIFLVLLPLFCLLAFSWVKAMTKEGQESFAA